MRQVYLDHAATTPVHEAAVDAMRRVMLEGWGNPSSAHAVGREAKRWLEEARARVAAALGADPAEIIFTSGATEADNLAITGAVRARRAEAERRDGRRPHVVTSAVEHHAVLETCEALAAAGEADVTVLPVDATGLVDPEDVRAALRPETVLVSVMAANNEVGTVQPVEEIAAVCRERGVLFHTDAVQAFGQLPLDVRAVGADLVAVASHKIYGPKGAGALWVRRGVVLAPLLHGGSHERSRRPGTEAVPALVGFGVAAELAAREREARAARFAALRDRLWEGVRSRIDGVRLNGHPARRLPNNLHCSFAGVDGELLLLNLDLAGVACSSGSACASGAVEPSHVLRAIGAAGPDAGALRLTTGLSNTEDDVTYALDALAGVVARLRARKAAAAAGGAAATGAAAGGEGR